MPDSKPRPQPPTPQTRPEPTPHGGGSSGRPGIMDNEQNPSGQSQRGRDMMDEPGGSRPNESEQARGGVGSASDRDAPGVPGRDGH